jgi:hypothetical protein
MHLDNHQTVLNTTSEVRKHEASVNIGIVGTKPSTFFYIKNKINIELKMWGPAYGSAKKWLRQDLQH